ncbi:MAG: L-threonylcarbamoyladenylate synthase [Candidatus Micrarchaeaceae archaeon]
MKTVVAKVDASNPDKKVIARAARVIRHGGIVIFPTETVYGIGADAYNTKAVKRIYKIKGRPADNPSMIHVSSMEMARQIGKFPDKYARIIEKLWPAPISFVVEAKKGLGRKEVSIRMPEHKVALELIKASGTPIAAPSANISKRPSSTTAKHALGYFNGKVEFILDAGHSQKGIESTILDLRTFEIQRPGAFPVESITEAFGKKPKVTKIAKGIVEAKRAVAPGMKYKHYAPKTPLFLYTGSPKLIKDITAGLGKDAVFIGSSESCRIAKGNGCAAISLGSRDKLDTIAKSLFDALIKLDSMNAKFAIAESFPENGIGLGIMNRLRKASSHKYFSTKRQFEKLYRLQE